MSFLDADNRFVDETKEENGEVHIVEKYNYLDELDSVRNSEAEILYGQKSLFEKVVCEGEYVVLTYNQVTDSPAFLAALKTEEGLLSFMTLFEYERIKISRFGYIRTPAQYILNAINKAITGIINSDKKNTRYYFSFMPKISDDFFMLCVMKEAIMNSDSAYIEQAVDVKEGSIIQIVKERYRKEFAGKCDKVIDIKRVYSIYDIQFLRRLVEIILYISRKENLYIEAKNQNLHTTHEYLKKVAEEEFLRDIESLEWQDECGENFFVTDELKAAADIIRETKSFEKQANNRSDYLNELSEMKKADSVRGEKPYKIANILVDICLNYAMESSINAETTYRQSEADTGKEDFVGDFTQKLVRYWKQYISLSHSFLKADREQQLVLPRELPPWKAGKERFEKIGTLRLLKGKGIGEWIDKRSWKWRTKVGIFVIVFLLIGLANLILFSVVQEGIGFIQARANCIKLTFEGIVNMFIRNTIALIILGIVSEIICYIMGIPDIVDTIKNLWGFICKEYQIIKWRIHKGE